MSRIMTLPQGPSQRLPGAGVHGRPGRKPKFYQEAAGPDHGKQYQQRHDQAEQEIRKLRRYHLFSLLFIFFSQSAQPPPECQKKRSLNEQDGDSVCRQDKPRQHGQDKGEEEQGDEDARGHVHGGTVLPPPQFAPGATEHPENETAPQIGAGQEDTGQQEQGAVGEAFSLFPHLGHENAKEKHHGKGKQGKDERSPKMGPFEEAFLVFPSVCGLLPALG